MSINSLLTILPAPKIPVETPSLEDWTTVEKQIGKLPADFKIFIERYGSGTINRFLWVLNPFSVNKHANLLNRMEPVMDAIRELKKDWPEQHPYKLFPEPGGLLPFGGSDNGDTFFWQTVGEPDKWTIVVNAARDPDYELFDCCMVDFLVGILTRRIHCSIFPKSFPSEAPIFTPMLLKS